MTDYIFNNNFFIGLGVIVLCIIIAALYRLYRFFFKNKKSRRARFLRGGR
jgi:hypothetical protein